MDRSFFGRICPAGVRDGAMEKAAPRQEKTDDTQRTPSGSIIGPPTGTARARDASRPDETGRPGRLEHSRVDKALREMVAVANGGQGGQGEHVR